MATVAVIGLGAFGLVTLKNLLEEGYDAVGFDSNAYIGGIWHFTTQRSTSALESTIVNISRQRCCFTDFPFKDGTSSYPTAAEVDLYLNDYADHFKLRDRLKLGTSVLSVDRTDEKWLVKTRTTNGMITEQLFDKVVCANGPDTVPIMPKLQNSSVFTGRILHSIDYKRPQDFRDQSVLVVGMGNSAADTATTLVGIAAKVSLSHRHGSLFLPRFMPDGTCFDHSANYRTFVFRDLLESVAPTLAMGFIDWFVQSTSKKVFNFKPEWALSPIPSLLHKLPVVSDTLIDEFEAGNIVSVPGIDEVVGPRQVRLTNGSVVEVDVIIFCTGYRCDYSFLGKNDPSIIRQATTDDKEARDHAAPRLYQNVLSLEYPDSLAFVGAAITYFAAFLGADIASMAVAQLWHDASQLPTQREMETWYQRHLSWANSIRKRGTFISNMTEFGSWMKWIEESAGTHVDDHLRYFSLDAWKFWWKDRKMCQLMLDGIYSPHAFRLFPSEKRRAWDGAREAIERVNAEVQQQKKDRGKRAQNPVS